VNTRINTYAHMDEIKPLLAIEERLAAGSLGKTLLHLIKMRVSQINGCAYCLHMHSTEALADGETPARLFLLDAWEESKLYTPRERAALAWAETLTNVSVTHAPDEDFEALKTEFDEAEIVQLTLAITNINAWNRISIGFRAQHPHDKPVAQKAA
jgi:AhpD family alkylhydroperoxidase